MFRKRGVIRQTMFIPLSAKKRSLVPKMYHITAVSVRYFFFKSCPIYKLCLFRYAFACRNFVDQAKFKYALAYSHIQELHPCIRSLYC